MAMHELKQSTAVSILVGPLLSDDDATTPVTALTVGDITATITKGVTQTSLTLTASGGSNDFVHLADGYWSLELTGTDTNTLGNASVTLRDDDVFIAKRETIHVSTANVWDSWYSTDNLDVSLVQVLGTACTESSTTAGVLDVNVAEISDNVAAADNLQTAAAASALTCNVTQISDDATAAANCELFFDGTGYAGGTTKLRTDVRQIGSNQSAAAQLRDILLASGDSTATGIAFVVDDSAAAPTTTTFRVDTGDSTDDHYNGRRVLWVTSAVLFGAEYQITDYNGTTKEFTVDQMVAAPADGDRFFIV